MGRTQSCGLDRLWHVVSLCHFTIDQKKKPFCPAETYKEPWNLDLSWNPMTKVPIQRPSFRPLFRFGSRSLAKLGQVEPFQRVIVLPNHTHSASTLSWCKC